MTPSPRSQATAGPRLLPYAVALVPFLLLAARFDWLCDDAFISFRYAKNLADGHGLRFNLGEHRPVEGYTNLLWVLWLSLCERLEGPTPVFARASSLACGAALVVAVVRFVRLRISPRAAVTIPAALFLGTLPPLAVWSTSGLATMPFALAIFVAFERLLGDPERPRGLQAGVAVVAVVLLRADGFGFAGLVLAAAGLRWLRTREPRLLRAGAIGAAFLVVTVASHFLWRHAYYGDWVPNTAHAKVDSGSETYVQGLQYVGTWLLVFPGIPIALLAAAALPGARRVPAAGACAVMVAGTLAYTLLVGGDFMTMGRFLVPALPFTVLLLAAAAHALDAPARVWRPVALGLACVALTLPTAFDVHVAPRAWREACHFRWGNKRYLTEHESWSRMKSHAQEWSTIGRALALHTAPGETMTASGIGCFGYFTDLFIVDVLGLVNREVATNPAYHDKRNESRGHQIHANQAYLDLVRPRYAGAHVYPRGEVRALNERQALDFEQLVFPLEEADGFPRDSVLVILRKRYAEDPPETP